MCTGRSWVFPVKRNKANYSLSKEHYLTRLLRQMLMAPKNHLKKPQYWWESLPANASGTYACHWSWDREKLQNMFYCKTQEKQCGCNCIQVIYVCAGYVGSRLTLQFLIDVQHPKITVSHFCDEFPSGFFLFFPLIIYLLPLSLSYP